MIRKRSLFLALFLLSACGSNPGTVREEAAAIPVLATEAIVKDVPVFVEAVGVLRASVTAEVRPRVSGTIAEVLVAEGDWVKADAPLLKIDSASYAIKFQESMAKLSMDTAALKSAERKLGRFKTLAEKDLISQADWDELETAVEKAAAVVEADQAGVGTAALDVDGCTLKSCIEGRVGRLNVHPGLLVSSGQAASLMTVVKMNPLFAEFMLTEKEMKQLSSDRNRIELVSIHGEGNLGVGTITFFDNSYDEKTGLILVRALVENAENALRPGQIVKVRVLTSTIAGATLVPQKAVKYNQEGPYIYVVGSDSGVEMRKVDLGMALGDLVILSAGLGPHEKVITDGHMRLYPGSKVEVKE